MATRCSILAENSMGRGAWPAVIHGVAKIWTQLTYSPEKRSTVSFCISDLSHRAVCCIPRICFCLLTTCSHLPDHLPLGAAHQRSVSVSPVQSLSRVPLFETPWTVAHQASLSSVASKSQSLLKLMSVELCPSNHLILCRPFLLPPSFFPSIRVFSNE